MTHRNVEILDEIVEEAREQNNVARDLRDTIVEHLVFQEMPESEWHDFVYERFLMSDTTNSAEIDETEFLEFFRCLDVHFTRKTTQRIFRAMDLDRNGALSWKEIQATIFPEYALQQSQQEQALQQEDTEDDGRSTSRKAATPNKSAARMARIGGRTSSMSSMSSDDGDNTSAEPYFVRRSQGAGRQHLSNPLGSLEATSGSGESRAWAGSGSRASAGTDDGLGLSGHHQGLPPPPPTCTVEGVYLAIDRVEEEEEEEEGSEREEKRKGEEEELTEDARAMLDLSMSFEEFPDLPSDEEHDSSNDERNRNNDSNSASNTSLAALAPLDIEAINGDDK